MENKTNDLFSTQKYNQDNFFLIAGPCIVESEELVMEVAEKVSARSWKFLIFLKLRTERLTVPVAIHLPA
jgi:3-deoxy-D-arabino-heptulosonate 7-phosphate (DAHP) synthase